MPNKVEESLRWLGISSKTQITPAEVVYDALVVIAKKTRAPVRVTDIAARIGRHRNRVIVHLGNLRDRNRVANIVGGWIPLR